MFFVFSAPSPAQYRSPRHVSQTGLHRLALASGALLLVATMVAGCRSTAASGDDAYAAGSGAEAGERVAGPRCESDYARYAESREISQLGQKSKSLAGTTASYAAAGSVAVTETILYTTGGIALGALVCSPIFAIEAASESDNHASIECVVRIGSYAMTALIADAEYSLTQNVWQATEGMRVESYDQLAAYLLDSAECRIERNGPGDREQALRQLRALRDEAGIWPHLSQFSIERAERLEDLAREAQPGASQG